MSNKKSGDNLPFVAAALSALTNKCIVPIEKYKEIENKINRGADTGFDLKGELEIVKEIKRTYAKTPVLVATRFHPEIVEQVERLCLESTVLNAESMNDELGIAIDGNTEIILNQSNCEEVYPSQTNEFDILQSHENHQNICIDETSEYPINKTEEIYQYISKKFSGKNSKILSKVPSKSAIETITQPTPSDITIHTKSVEDTARIIQSYAQSENKIEILLKVPSKSGIETTTQLVQPTPSDITIPTKSVEDTARIIQSYAQTESKDTARILPSYEQTESKSKKLLKVPSKSGIETTTQLAQSTPSDITIHTKSVKNTARVIQSYAQTESKDSARILPSYDRKDSKRKILSQSVSETTKASNVTQIKEKSKKDVEKKRVRTKGNRSVSDIYELMQQDKSSNESLLSSQDYDVKEKIYYRNSEPDYYSSDDETLFRKYYVGRQKIKKHPFKTHRSGSGERSLHSSEEDVFRVSHGKESLIKNKDLTSHISELKQVRVESSSEENPEVYSDDERLIRKKKTKKTSEMNFERKACYQAGEFDEDPFGLTQDVDTFRDVKDTQSLLVKYSGKIKKDKFPNTGINSETTRSHSSIDLQVITPSGNTIILSVASRDCTIDYLKCQIQQKSDIPNSDQILSFGGNLLADSYTLKDYGITTNSNIHLNYKLRGGKRKNKNLFFISKQDLDPDWDYSFKRMQDDETKFMRGGYPYYRPYGWKRIAFRVLGNYEDDTWLGAGGIQRANESDGEWPVSYHGTTRTKPIKQISSGGYKIGTGDKFGIGVYSTPFIQEAAQYAPIFKHRFKTYHAVLQNRVDPKNIQIKFNGKYWICSDPKSVRPYGICIQRYHRPKEPPFDKSMI